MTGAWSQVEEPSDHELVILSIPGVQQFIGESRTTSDLSAGSAIVERLAGRAARECVRLGARLVFPAGLPGTDAAGPAGRQEDEPGDRPGGRPDVATAPNRVVALAPEGEGKAIASAAAAAVHTDWESLVRGVLGRLVVTPGMPSVQWVTVPAAPESYREQWRTAQRLLVARKRVRDFEAVEEPDRGLCSLSARWPAEPRAPAGVPAHERGERLAAANWVKRRYRYTAELKEASPEAEIPQGFPSTSSIASAPFRKAVQATLDTPAVRKAVGQLRMASHELEQVRERPVPALRPDRRDGADADATWLLRSAGRWVYPDAWQEQEEVAARKYRSVGTDERTRAVARGAGAVRELYRVMWEERGVVPPAPYLALLAQDLDGMGRFLSGEAEATGLTGSGPGAGAGAGAVRGWRPVTEEWHREVSAQLSRLGAATCELLQSHEHYGVPVYAGGDDVLAFAPAAHALDAARACREAVPDTLPSASSAVLFFHHRSPLRRIVHEVQRLLEAAKEGVAGKNGLAVGYLRRSGVREQSLQPWRRRDGTGPVQDFTRFIAHAPAGPRDEDGAGAGAGAGVDGNAGAGAGAGQRLSLRLVQDCLRDEAELITLPEDLFTAEIRRLVTRHGGTGPQADALVRLAAAESSRRPGKGTWRLAEPAKIAAFLRQECPGGGA